MNPLALTEDELPTLPTFYYAPIGSIFTADQLRTAMQAAAAAQLEKVLRQGEPVVHRHWHGEENGGWEYYEAASCEQCQPLYLHPAPDQAARIAELEQQVSELRKDAERYR